MPSVNHQYRPPIFLLFLFVLCNLDCEAHQGDECRLDSLKYLSTFIPSKKWESFKDEKKWGREEISKMISMTKKGKENFFFIPIMMFHIKELYKKNDWTEEEKNYARHISEFFKTLFSNEDLLIKKKNDSAFCYGLKGLAEKYYSLCENDTSFSRMIFTMDDGPFYGVKTTKNLPLKDSLYFDDIKSKMYLREQGDSSVIELVDSSGTTKWRRVLTGLNDQLIKDIHLPEDPIKVRNGLGYKLALSGSREMITLYLRADGDFRFYFHSW